MATSTLKSRLLLTRLRSESKLENQGKPVAVLSRFCLECTSLFPTMSACRVWLEWFRVCSPLGWPRARPPGTGTVSGFQVGRRETTSPRRWLRRPFLPPWREFRLHRIYLLQLRLLRGQPVRHPRVSSRSSAKRQRVKHGSLFHAGAGLGGSLRPRWWPRHSHRRSRCARGTGFWCCEPAACWCDGMASKCN